jgi:lysophospholipase L1-like esterase
MAVELAPVPDKMKAAGIGVAPPMIAAFDDGIPKDAINVLPSAKVASYSTDSSGNVTGLVDPKNAIIAMASNPQYQFAPKYPLTKWRLAKRKALGKVRPANLLFIGDSITAGQGSGSGTLNGVGAMSNGYATQVTKMVNNRHMTATKGTFIGDQFFNLVVPYGQYDTRITLGSWTETYIASMGGNCFTAASAAGGPLTFTPTMPNGDPMKFDSFVVYYLSGAGGGTFNVQVDALTPLVLSNVGGSAALVSATQTIAGTLASHTLNFNWLTASAYIIGAACWNSADPGIVVYQDGICGSIIAEVAKTTGFQHSMTIPQVAPDLTIINMTGNDTIAGTSISAYQASLQAVVNTCLATGDVVLVVEQVLNQANYINGYGDQIAAANYAVAAASNINVIDVRNYFGSTWVAANAAGYMYDNNHPSPLGHATMADMVYQVVAYN